jgi:predicted small secreted protein
MKRTLLYALTLTLASLSLGACSWAGKTTGKAVNAVEQGATEFEQGYQQERSPKDREQDAE